MFEELALERAVILSQSPVAWFRWERGRLFDESGPAATHTGCWNLLRGLRLRRASGPLTPSGQTVAFLEAGAASSVASLSEGRCEIIAAAISADQPFRFRCCRQWQLRPLCDLLGGIRVPV